MAHAVDIRLSDMLDAAERAARCLVLTLQADQRAARRRDREILLLAPRICVRAVYWRKLGPKQKVIHLARALAKIHPDWMFTHTTAAVLHGLYVSYADIQKDGKPLLHVQGKSETLVYPEFTVKCGLFLPEIRVKKQVLGLPAADAMTTALECACSLTFPKALAIADSADRFYGLGRGAMLSVIEQCGRGLRGIKTARRAFSHANPASENGGESIARGVMIEEGFQEPLVQVPVIDCIDGEEYRTDFAWMDEVRAIALGELDGQEKLLNEEMRAGRSVAHAVRDERLRESRLTINGVKVVRFTMEIVENRQAFTNLLDAYGIPRVR